jgi:thiol-disulfide isomerase/thioredoxin
MAQYAFWFPQAPDPHKFIVDVHQRLIAQQPEMACIVRLDPNMASVQRRTSRTNELHERRVASRRPRRDFFTLLVVPTGPLLVLMFSLINLVSFPSPSLSFTAVQSHQCRRQNMFVLHGSKSGGHLLKTSAEYETAIAGGGNDDHLPVMVWFTAPWCGPCRLSIPVVKDIIKQFGGKLLSYEICTDDLPDVAAAADVVSIPTIHLYFRGECRLCSQVTASNN